MGGFYTKTKQSNPSIPSISSNLPQQQQKTALVSESDKAVVLILQNKVKLEKSEKRLLSLSTGLTKAALDAKLAGDLDGARYLLKVRAIKKEQLDTVRLQMERLRTMFNDLDTAQQNVTFAKAMEGVTNALRAFESAMPAERVEQILLDHKDAKDSIEEINQLFDSSLGINANSKEDEIDAELAAIGLLASNKSIQSSNIIGSNSSSDTQLITQPLSNEQVLQFPDVPTHKPVNVTTSDSLMVNKEEEARQEEDGVLIVA